MNDPEERLGRIRSWLREDYLRSFESAMSWGWPRCRTDEERLLFPLLILALSPYQAVVAPRRLGDGERLGFQVSYSRRTRTGTERRHLWVIGLEGEDGEALPISEEDTDESHRVFLNAALIRTEPWKAAAQVMEALQKQMFEGESAFSAAVE